MKFTPTLVALFHNMVFFRCWSLCEVPTSSGIHSSDRKASAVFICRGPPRFQRGFAPTLLHRICLFVFACPWRSQRQSHNEERTSRFESHVHKRIRDTTAIHDVWNFHGMNRSVRDTILAKSDSAGAQVLVWFRFEHLDRRAVFSVCRDNGGASIWEPPGCWCNISPFEGPRLATLGIVPLAGAPKVC